MSTLPSEETSYFAPALVPVSIESGSQVDAGPDSVCEPDEPVLRPSPDIEEGFLPIAIMAKDGKRRVRSFRSRWSHTEQGRVEVVQTFCPDCSAPLIVQDLHLRVARRFACQLLCLGCSHGAIACGSRRTLLMTLRMLIDEKRFESHRGSKVDRSRLCATGADTPA